MLLHRHKVDGIEDNRDDGHHSRGVHRAHQPGSPTALGGPGNGVVVQAFAAGRQTQVLGGELRCLYQVVFG